MKNLSNKIYYLSFFTAIFGLSSCAVGPKFQSPSVVSPTTYIYDSVETDTIVNLEWWELFKDEKLDTLVKLALANNKDAQIAASRIQEAAFIVGFNRADYFPQIGYNGSAIRGNIGPGGTPSEAFGNLFTGVGNVYWEIDFWGKYRRATEAAKAELLASEYGKRNLEISLISGVSTLYFQLMDFKARLRISQGTLVSRKESLRIIGERFKEGIIPEIDLNQAQVQEAIAAANVPLYERLVANTEHALSVLIGANPKSFDTKLLIDQSIPPEIPNGIPSDLLQRRPDILQAEQIYKAQNARIGVAQAQRFPSISLTGALGAASSDLSNFLSADAMVWSASAGITGPIFNFGKNKRRVDIERERAQQAKLSYENTVIKAFQEVEDALIGVSTVVRELEAYERQLRAAENAARLSKARYDGGVTSYLEVLETERSLFESELKAADAYQRMLVSYVQLYKALGGGWISEQEKIESTSAE
jgi:multidrug efflux system outer membrane protein